MVQCRCRSRLVLESPQPVGISGEQRQDLDRHITSEPRIAGAINLTHAAGTEQRFDLVLAQPCPRGESYSKRGGLQEAGAHVRAGG
jgi:hypothetical protein